MRFECSIPKATNTHSEYVIRIALPRQKCSRERASMLRHTYTARLVKDEGFICQHTPVAHGKIPSPLLLVHVSGYRGNCRQTGGVLCRTPEVLTLIKSSFLQSSVRHSDCSTRTAMAALRRRNWAASCGVWGNSRARKSSSRCYTKWTLTVRIRMFAEIAGIQTAWKNPS